jgi:hypothetical protein
MRVPNFKSSLPAVLLVTTAANILAGSVQSALALLPCKCICLTIPRNVSNIML